MNLHLFSRAALCTLLKSRGVEAMVDDSSFSSLFG